MRLHPNPIHESASADNSYLLSFQYSTCNPLRIYILQACPFLTRLLSRFCPNRYGGRGGN